MKSAFLTPLKTEDVDGGACKFKLLEDFKYSSKIFKGIIIVPKGFVSDGTSDLLKDDTRGPAVIHDFLYQKHPVSKHKADRIFLEAMKTYKTNFRERWMKYLGVVILGQSSYNSGPERFKILNG